MGVGLGPRISSTRQTFFYWSMVSCNFIALKRAIKFFVVSLVDPFFMEYIVLYKDTTHYSTSNFHDIHSI